MEFQRMGPASQSTVIKRIQRIHDSLTKEQISRLIHKQVFFHAREELPHYVPNQHLPPSHSQLARKIIGQLITPSDAYHLLQQLKHRVGVIEKDEMCSQVHQVRNMWEAEQTWIRKSGLRVKDFKGIFEEVSEKEDSSLVAKKMRLYMEKNQERPAEDMIKQLMAAAGAQQEEEESEEELELEEGTIFEADMLLEEVRVLEEAFTFLK